MSCSGGAVTIDSILSERELERVVLASKNRLFVGNLQRKNGGDPLLRPAAD